MNLAMEARDFYNENEKTLIKETIQHTSKKPYAHIHIQNTYRHIYIHTKPHA